MKRADATTTDAESERERARAGDRGRDDSGSTRGARPDRAVASLQRRLGNGTLQRLATRGGVRADGADAGPAPPQPTRRGDAPGADSRDGGGTGTGETSSDVRPSATTRAPGATGSPRVDRAGGPGSSDLSVSEPTDPAEREAEAVADAVTAESPGFRAARTPGGPGSGAAEPAAGAPGDAVLGSSTVAVGRLCDRCVARLAAGRPLDCPDCERRLQRATDGAGGSGARDGTGGSGPPDGTGAGPRGAGTGSTLGQDSGGGAPDVAAAIDAARGTGHPLPERTRSTLEPRFGYDFGDVRVHTGPDADRLAGSLHATAFTTGSDVFFAAGEYRPGTPAGRRLLAHELTHVVQQTRPSRTPTDQPGEPAVPSSGHPGQSHDSEGPDSTATGVRREPDPRPPRQPRRSHDPAEGEARTAAAAVAAGSTVDVERSAQDGAVQRYGFGDLTSDVGGLVNSAASSAYEAGETAVRTGAEAAGTAATAVAETGEAVVDRGKEFVEESVEAVGEAGRALVERVAPGLIEFLRNPGGRIRDALASGLDSFVSGALDVLGVEDVGGLFARLQETFASASETVTTVASRLASGIGDTLGATLGPLLSAVENRAFPLLEDVQELVATVQGAVGSVLETIEGPVEAFVRGVGGDVWGTVVDVASWAWELTEPLRSYAREAWSWVMERFGIAWESSEGVRSWLLDAAGDVWDAIVSTVEPVVSTLSTAGEALSKLAGFGPVQKLTSAVASLWESLGWVVENWNTGDVLVRARTILGERVLPAVLDGVGTVTGLLGRVQTWVTGAVGDVTSAFESAVAAIRGVPILETVAGAAGSLRRQVGRLATWADSAFDSLLGSVSSALGALGSQLEPVLDFLVQLGQVVTAPLRLPTLLAGTLWRRLPDRFKPPTIDFLLDALVSFVKGFPAFATMLGPLAVVVKEGVVGFLERLRDTSVEVKVSVSNRIAGLLQGSVEFAKGYLWGTLRGLWEGLTDPFRIIYMLGQVAVGASRFLAQHVGRLFGAEEAEGTRAEQARQRLEAAATRTEGAGRQVESATDRASSQANATPGGIFEMLRSVWSSVLAKSSEIGSSIAGALLEFVQLPDFELGDRLGWVGGTVLFEVVLYVLTAGSWAAVTASRPILRGILRFIDLGGELVGAVAKGLAKLQRPVTSAMGKIGDLVRLVPGLGRVWDDVASALRSLFRVSDEASPAGRATAPATGAAGAGGARGSADATAGAAGDSGSRAVDEVTEAGGAGGGRTGSDVAGGTGGTGAGRTGREPAASVDDADPIATASARNARDEVHEFEVVSGGRIVRCSEKCAELVSSVRGRVSDIRSTAAPDSPAFGRAKELVEEAERIQTRLQDGAISESDALGEAIRLEDEVSKLARSVDPEDATMTATEAMRRQSELAEGEGFESVGELLLPDGGTFRIEELQEAYARYGGELGPAAWARHQTTGDASDILEGLLGPGFRRQGSSRGWDWHKARQDFLEEAMKDRKQPAWVRGFLENQFEQKGTSYSGWIKTPPGFNVGHPPGGSRVLEGSDAGLRLEFTADNLSRSYAERLFKMYKESDSEAEQAALWEMIRRHFRGE